MVHDLATIATNSVVYVDLFASESPEVVAEPRPFGPRHKRIRRSVSVHLVWLMRTDMPDAEEVATQFRQKLRGDEVSAFAPQWSDPHVAPRCLGLGCRHQIVHRSRP